MKWTGLNQLREEFLSFFESKGHLRYPSASLVPHDDGSLLLINSGMAPLKNYFLGLETPPSKRLTTCQKCIRTPDIEEVGKTSRHGTFFEMLGNFSFGDYFKKEATAWSLEFLTKTLEIPLEKLWFTIYQDDDEAFDIWTKDLNIDPNRVVRLGKKDNFWEIGAGPCGPCSEIHFDRGEEYGCDAPECGIGKCECDRYMEIWNLVFTQFDSDGNGNYTPLENPNIDTGMGLERLACVMQGVGNLFEVDTVKNIMAHITDICGVAYKTSEKQDVSLRVITDHIRSTVFMIGDGVIPSNEGRGYVLRRLLRRAARHGHLLGVNRPFLYEVCDTVIKENQNIYPELLEKREYIKTVIKAEEERFAKTIQQGMETLNQIIEKLEKDSANGRIIASKDAFQLYDTFGFPIDLTREIAADHGVIVDEKGFAEYMNEQRARARKAHEEHGGIGWDEDVLADQDISDSFSGYTNNCEQTKIAAIVQDGALLDSIVAGQEAGLVINETPFYAESGGQVGDHGTITMGESIFEVYDTKKTPTGHFLHIGKMISGGLKPGDTVSAQIDVIRRGRIMRNHTATHLLHAALREMLGEHIQQAGSYVASELARFDFTNFSALTQEQLKQIEETVNLKIFESLPVTVEEMPIQQAKANGAMALFGDKYSDIVRVCSIMDASTELCGGTHVHNTAQIGVFKILSESSVAAGVRRIEFTTSIGVLAAFNRQIENLQKVGQILKVNSAEELIRKAVAVSDQLEDLKSQVESLEHQIASNKTQNIEDNLKTVGPVKVAAIAVAGKIDPLQKQADQLKTKYPDLVGVLIAMGDDSATALVFAGADAVKAGIHSGNLVKKLSEIAGGKGGGRPDNAKGGMPDITKVDNALASVTKLVEEQLNN